MTRILVIAFALAVAGCNTVADREARVDAAMAKAIAQCKPFEGRPTWELCLNTMGEAALHPGAAPPPAVVLAPAAAAPPRDSVTCTASTMGNLTSATCL